MINVPPRTEDYWRCNWFYVEERCQSLYRQIPFFRLLLSYLVYSSQRFSMLNTFATFISVVGGPMVRSQSIVLEIPGSMPAFATNVPRCFYCKLLPPYECPTYVYFSVFYDNLKLQFTWTFRTGISKIHSLTDTKEILQLFVV